MMYDTDKIFIIIIFSFTITVYTVFTYINTNRSDQETNQEPQQNKQQSKNSIKSTARKIQTITGSWIVMLGVLFGSYLLGEITTALLIVFIGIKSIHEILRVMHDDRNNQPKIKVMARVLIICVLIMSGSWLHLNHLLSLESQRSVLLFMIFIIQFNDVNQYVAGTTLGHKLFKQKLAAKISPNKTIEGAVFGSLATGILAIPFGQLLTDFTIVSCFFMAVLLALTGLMGDLLQSSVKRGYNVKDMGNWIQGHGGIMDRVDSLVLAVPMFYVMYIFT